MSRLFQALRGFVRHTGGATAIEYGMILAVLSIVVIGAVTNAGTGLFTTMSSLSNKIAGR